MTDQVTERMTKQFADRLRKISYGCIGLGLTVLGVGAGLHENNKVEIAGSSIAWLGSIGAIATFRDLDGKLVINKPPVMARANVLVSAADHRAKPAPQIGHLAIVDAA